MAVMASSGERQEAPLFCCRMVYRDLKANNEISNIRELYVQMTRHIFGTILYHNLFKLLHMRGYAKPNY